ncbi:MAG: hypothetical protein EU532_12365 [Promethearchaeota archaeon]|nr:MAG: hypothetical protein EU532_12365 [Candidatus Lokiarchaeota archaeon]
MSYSQDESALRKILKTIINSTPGLKHAILIDDTGITIMNESKFRFSNEQEISVEKIGAIGGAVFTAGEEQGHILGYGTTELQITEYDKGLIFSGKTGKGILCIVTDKNVQIGYMRTIIKRFAPKITQILNRYLQSDQGELNKELKDLFSSDTMGLF